MAAVKTLSNVTTGKRFSSIAIKTKSVIDIGCQSPTVHVTSSPCRKHDSHPKKANQSQERQPPQQVHQQQMIPHQIITGKRRSSDPRINRPRQEQPPMTSSKKPSTCTARGHDTAAAGTRTARCQELASGTAAAGYCATETVHTSPIVLPSNRPLPINWSSSELHSWRSSNDYTDDVGGNLSADFLIEASSTGYDVTSSNSAFDRRHRSSIEDDVNSLHFPPIATSSTCLIHVIWDTDINNNSSNYKYDNSRVDNNENSRTGSREHQLISDEHGVKRHLVDHSHLIRRQPTAVERSTTSRSPPDSSSPGVDDLGNHAALSPISGDLSSIPPKCPRAPTRRGGTKSYPKKSDALRSDRRTTNDDPALRKWKSQPVLELPQLPTSDRKSTALRSKPTSAVVMTSHYDETTPCPSNNFCDSLTMERILSWLIGVDESGPAERPQTPFVFDDEPTQTDTAIHIIYGGD